MLEVLQNHNYQFPDPEQALEDPPGLLASGGDLSPLRLFNAYAQGIFPWYSQGTPPLWWSPPERALITAESLHLSRSLKKLMRSESFQANHELTYNQAFSEVIHQCAGPRAHETGTWITPDMIQAYEALHQLGLAHSIELWHLTDQKREKRLIGGLYGIALGGFFFW